jgi:putative ABC transport system permease protein
MFVVLARMDDETARAQLPRDVSAAFPNVSSLDLAQVQATLEALVGRVARAIRFMALFSLAAGAIVVVGAVAAGRRQRVREGVLLKTLGATRAQVLRILTAEYAALGLLSAAAALVLSAAAGWGLVRFAFEARFTLPVAGLLALASAVVAGTVGVGLLGSREVFRHPPLEVLREE